MSVSLYSNEYVARIEQDRQALIEICSMLMDDKSLTAKDIFDIHGLIRIEVLTARKPLPPRRNSAINNG